MSKITNIFISRSLSPDSIIKKLASDCLSIHDESLITFNPITYSFEDQYDWVFFYSKNGIKAFTENFTLCPNAKFGVMGKASAEYLKKLTGRSPEFVYANTKKSFNRFDRLTKNKSIVFLQAKKSLERFQKEFSNNQQISSIVCYENKVKVDFTLVDCDVLVFTSPLNARAYFEKYEYKKAQKLYAIGKTTRSSIFELTQEKAIIPTKPSIKALYKLLKKECTSD